MSEELQSAMALMECSSLDITAMMGVPQRGDALGADYVQNLPCFCCAFFCLLLSIVFFHIIIIPGKYNRSLAMELTDLISRFSVHIEKKVVKEY